MKGLIGIGVVLGCLVSAAQAAPEARIDCTGEPRIDGVDDKGVQLSTDVVGHVRVVDKLDVGEEDDEDVMDVTSFCKAHEGVDAFILPAPRIIDEPRSPDGEEELELQQPGHPAADKQVDDDEPEADDDGDDAHDEQASATKSRAGLVEMPGVHKSFDPQMVQPAECSQAVGRHQTGWWFALLPLLLMVRVRREGDR